MFERVDIFHGVHEIGVTAKSKGGMGVAGGRGDGMVVVVVTTLENSGKYKLS
jgi:hypothetical protein